MFCPRFTRAKETVPLSESSNRLGLSDACMSEDCEALVWLFG